MAIRIHAYGSKVYHLQTTGHPYWLTRCGRKWISPAAVNEEGRVVIRAATMDELRESEAQYMDLCKQCEKDWRRAFSVEIARLV